MTKASQSGPLAARSVRDRGGQSLKFEQIAALAEAPCLHRLREALRAWPPTLLGSAVMGPALLSAVTL